MGQGAGRGAEGRGQGEEGVWSEGMGAEVEVKVGDEGQRRLRKRKSGDRIDAEWAEET